MTQTILNGYQLMFDYTLIPIGSRYWITNAKVGSRYLTQFQTKGEDTLKIKITICTSDDEQQSPGNIIYDIGGVRCKVFVFMGTNNELDMGLTETKFKAIMNRCSVWLIRNPFERFKSGAIQKITEFYLDMRDVYLSKRGEWEKVLFTPNRSLHLDYPLDWSFFLERFPDENDNSPDMNKKWFDNWKRFAEYLFLDVSRYTDVSQILSGDVHTQPYLYHLKLLFTQLNIIDKLTILDISELDSRPDLLITELGKVKYDEIQSDLYNDYKKDERGNERTDDEYKQFVNESLVKYKNVNYTSLERYFQYSDIYRWEMVIYLMLLNSTK
jgi:hypothetical protein